MSAVLTTYSGLGIVGSITNPAFPQGIQISGIAEKGLAQIDVRMETDRTTMQKGMDGAIQPSYIAGDNGEFQIHCWQNSTIHQGLLLMYNTLKTAADQGDVSNWANSTIFIQDSSATTGSSHLGVGCGFTKPPDKSYQEQAQRVTWAFKAASIDNE